MKSGVLTSYKINNASYGSYILGSCMLAIRSAAEHRRLGETIESSITEVSTIPDYGTLSDEEFKKRLPEILHTACFLSFTALKSNAISLEDVLGDEGVLHELSHLIGNIEGCKKESLSCVRDSVKKLQEKTIGFYQPV